MLEHQRVLQFHCWQPKSNPSCVSQNKGTSLKTRLSGGHGFFCRQSVFGLQEVKQDQADISDFLCELRWVSTLPLHTEVIGAEVKMRPEVLATFILALLEPLSVTFLP